MPLIPFVAGRKLRAAELNAALDAVGRPAFQTADQTVNNSTVLVPSTGLTLPVAANSTYAFRCWVFYECEPETDMDLAWAVPAGATGQWGVLGPDFFQVPLAGAERINYADFSVNTLTTRKAVAGDDVAVGSTFICCQPSGFIETSGTAGNLTLQFAQDTAGASNTRLKKGSWMLLSKVA